MTTEEMIIHLFYHADDRMKGEADIAKHPQGALYPSELVTIGILWALKGVSFRAFYGWLKRGYDALFAGLPHRTNRQGGLASHQDWCDLLRAERSLFTVMDSFPIELLFPIREGRAEKQLGRTGRDKGRWMIGVRLWWLLANTGQVVEWYWQPMNVPDKAFNRLAATFDEQTITLADLVSVTKMARPLLSSCAPKALGMSACWSKPVSRCGLGSAMPSSSVIAYPTISGRTLLT